MATLRGKPATTPSIEAVRELTLAEVRQTPRAKVNALTKTLRDTHHKLARLIAMGLRMYEVSERSGYSLTSISILKGDPAFQELIQHYREIETEAFIGARDEYYADAISVRTTSLRLIKDRLDTAEPEDIPLNQLIAIHGDTADRTGYPRRRESVNHNVDWADRLDKAVRRSREVKQIEGKVIENQPAGGPPQPTAQPADPPARDGAGLTAGAAQAPPQRPRPSFPKELLPQPRFARRM